jgi:outer membrane protein OmpA-like peptidoglycan-associated protein
VKKLVGIFFILIFLSIGLNAQVEANKPYIGIHASGINNQWKMWSGGQIGLYFSKRIGIELSASTGWSRPEDNDDFNNYYATYLTPVSLSMKYNFTKDIKFVPYAMLGVGMLYWDLRDVTNEGSEKYSLSEKLGESVYGETKNDAMIIMGLGFEYYLSRVIGIEAGFRYNHMVEHEIDLSGYGGEQSGIVEARLGFNIHFVSAKDTDNDGILDKYDADPLNPEDFDGFEDEDGAPDPDNDGDGILDVDDKEPNLAEDIDGFEDEDGVPDPDNDGDGILDVDDKEPDLAEDFDGFEDEDGAPDPDNDGDGILDVDDKCPDEPETMNGYMDEDGCPDKKPEIIFEKKAPIILDGVTFASGSAELSNNTKNILEKVVHTLKDYPKMNLEINGYTDNTGSITFNMKISKQRAESVRNYLINQGIQADRLTANGYGPENPIVSNSTKEGRAKNRRIEFFRTR